MSNYFRILKRLETEHATDPEIQALGETAVKTIHSSPARLIEAAPTTEQLQSKRQRAFADLLDNLRAKTNASLFPRVVIAGISNDEAVAEVTAGLAGCAEAQGLRLFTGKFSVSRQNRMLEPSNISNFSPSPAAEVPPVSPQIPSLDLTTMSSEALDRWFKQVAAVHDFLLIHAPPLLRSVDAALLGRQCEGVLLVLEAQVTPRQALRTAVERIRTAECPNLGLVLTGTRQWLPRRIQEFLRPQRISS